MLLNFFHQTPHGRENSEALCFAPCISVSLLRWVGRLPSPQHRGLLLLPCPLHCREAGNYISHSHLRFLVLSQSGPRKGISTRLGRQRKEDAALPQRLSRAGAGRTQTAALQRLHDLLQVTCLGANSQDSHSSLRLTASGLQRRATGFPVFPESQWLLASSWDLPQVGLLRHLPSPALLKLLEACDSPHWNPLHSYQVILIETLK